MFKRLKNVENAQKNLVRVNDNESIYYASRSQFDSKDDKDKDKKTAKQQHRHKTTKCLWLFKKLSQEAEDLMDEMKDADKDIDAKNLHFIGSNRKKFNFNFLGSHWIFSQLYKMVKLH